MAQPHGMNKNEALNKLDLELGASKETILSRTKELADELKVSDNPADHAKLADIYAATQSLLEDEEHRVSSRRLKKKRMKIGLVSGIALTVVALVAVFSIISNNRDNTYSDLREMMKEVSIANYEDIGDILNDLPDNYEDVATFKDQYASIRSNIEMIENNNVFESTSVMRVAYYDLKELNEETDDWDLSYYLGRVDTRVLLLGVQWESSRAYFHLVKNPGEAIGTSLDSALPNAKDPEEDYYVYTLNNRRIIGFININDRTEKFKAYEILSIDEEALRIYAFTTDETYTLYSTSS